MFQSILLILDMDKGKVLTSLTPTTSIRFGKTFEYWWMERLSLPSILCHGITIIVWITNGMTGWKVWCVGSGSWIHGMLPSSMIGIHHAEQIIHHCWGKRKWLRAYKIYHNIDLRCQKKIYFWISIALLRVKQLIISRNKILRCWYSVIYAGFYL